MALFTHLKIILLQCFQFSAISGIQTDPYSMHYSWDPQVRILTKKNLKLDLTVLFTHLKIILLQCFQFSAINGIQTDP